MKNTTLLLALALTVGCNPKSKVSSSSVEKRDNKSESALSEKIQKQAGIECALTTQSGNKYFYVTKSSKKVKIRGKEETIDVVNLHDLQGNAYLPGLEINERIIPELIIDSDKKYVIARGTESGISLGVDDIDQQDNPDKMKGNMKVLAIQYKLILPNSVGQEGELLRAYTYNRKRGFLGNEGRTGDWKNIANIVDCKGTNDYHSLAK